MGNRPKITKKIEPIYDVDELTFAIKMKFKNIAEFARNVGVSSAAMYERIKIQSPEFLKLLIEQGIDLTTIKRNDNGRIGTKMIEITGDGNITGGVGETNVKKDGNGGNELLKKIEEVNDNVLGLKEQIKELKQELDNKQKVIEGLLELLKKK